MDLIIAAMHTFLEDLKGQIRLEYSAEYPEESLCVLSLRVKIDLMASNQSVKESTYGKLVLLAVLLLKINCFFICLII